MNYKPFNLKNELDYNKEHIQIKPLLENNESKLLLFALNEKQIVPKHTTPIKALIYIIEGMIEFYINGETHKMQTGEALYIKENILHEITALEKSKFIVARI